MNRRILRLAVPSILANISVPLVGMVDIAVAGRLGSAAAIGAIAVGTMLFDLLYWGFGFLRVSTGGLTAQAYGRKDMRDSMTHLTRGVATSAASALLIIAIQWIFVEFAFLFIDCTPEVEALSRQYFFIRVWAAPATLSLMAFKGWFIGMQNTVHSMAVDIAVSVVNIAASIFLGLYTPMGFAGIALGTVIAQYSGLLLAIAIMLLRYRKLFIHIDLRRDVKLKEMKSYFKMNGDLFIRSLCFMAIYCGYTTIAARFGDVQLAVSSIMMKLLMLYSYFTDGFAFAGEALVGRYIGANDRRSLIQAVKLIFIWCGGIVVASTVAYAAGGEWMIKLMTTERSVIEASEPYLIWLTLMPLFSCLAFTWDGIFIGATASVAIRNSMLWATAAFYLVWFVMKGFSGVQTLYIAYFAHLLARDIYLSARAKKDVFSKVPPTV